MRYDIPRRSSQVQTLEVVGMTIVLPTRILYLIIDSKSENWSYYAIADQPKRHNLPSDSSPLKTKTTKNIYIFLKKIKLEIL